MESYRRNKTRVLFFLVSYLGLASLARTVELVDDDGVLGVVQLDVLEYDVPRITGASLRF